MAAQAEPLTGNDAPECWPTAAMAGWLETCFTLQRWTQMVGKVRMALTPLVNHWWNVPLYVSARGLTTTAIPLGERNFELEFDFVRQTLELRLCDGETGSIPLQAGTVADFYHAFLKLLASHGIAVKFWAMPVEMPQPVRFDQDLRPAPYDPQVALTLWTILRTSAQMFEQFRAEYLGKCSPVHFFWGSFDLAVTRFSGRRAPEREGADAMTREAYSHEVASVGFWPGNLGGPVTAASYYAYAVPAAQGYSAARLAPAAARWDTGFGEFLLDYEAVRRAPSPSAALLDFCRSSYNAAADLGHWDRAALER